MRRVIKEIKDHTTLVEIQNYAGFVVTTWTKVGTPSRQQLHSVCIVLDRNVHSAGIDKDRGGMEEVLP